MKSDTDAHPLSPCGQKTGPSTSEPTTGAEPPRRGPREPAHFYDGNPVGGRLVGWVALHVAGPAALMPHDQIGHMPLLLDDCTEQRLRALSVALDRLFDGGCFRLRLGLVVGERATEGRLVALLDDAEFFTHARRLGLVLPAESTCGRDVP